MEYVKDQPKKMSNRTSNATKSSSISEHIVKNPVCGVSYNEMRFKTLRSCTDNFDIVKIEAIYIDLNKPKIKTKFFEKILENHYLNRGSAALCNLQARLFRNKNLGWPHLFRNSSNDK